MSKLSERIKELTVDMPRGWQADLARHCKVRAPSVADWVSGKTKTLEGENLLRAASFFKVDPAWLASGKGNKEPQKGACWLSQEELEWLSMRERLGADDRKTLFSLGSSLAKQSDKKPHSNKQ